MDKAKLIKIENDVIRLIMERAIQPGESEFFPDFERMYDPLVPVPNDYWSRVAIFSRDVFRKIEETVGRFTPIVSISDEEDGITVNVLLTETREYYFELIRLKNGEPDVLRPPKYWEIREMVETANWVFETTDKINERANAKKG